MRKSEENLVSSYKPPLSKGKITIVSTYTYRFEITNDQSEEDAKLSPLT